ncbi:MAG: hypothetical protein JWR69_3761 [Pedosphaera sp.]|nr:hypothetical protein [Pedosphaera sp.]
MKRNLSLVLLLACTIAFALGLAQLFKLRFESGDVYPAYSSLRTDPLGTSGFYESLEQLPGISARRDYSAGDQLPEGRNVAYLHLAGKSSQWKTFSAESFAKMESFLKQGGRLVVAFSPETSKGYESAFSRKKKKTEESKDPPPEVEEPVKPKPAKKPRKSNKPAGEDELAVPQISIKERWGVESVFQGMAGDNGEAYDSIEVLNHGDPSLPDSISWHSGLVFTNLDAAWRTLYTRKSGAVLIERKFGSGSLVFSTDSYFLSNEALRKDRQPSLLAWLAGPCQRIVFDEAHLGVVENPGVATLIRKYRLQGMVAALLLLAGLYIWKNSVSLVPLHADEPVEAYVTGKDSAAGFVNLLRQHVPASQLLNVCLAEWKKSSGRGTFSAAKLGRVQAVIDAENALPAKERNAIRAYQTICRVLKEGSGSPVSSSESKAN